LDVSGKTGTAQVISLTGRKAARNSEKDLRDHGWFVFFAPRDNPEIAGVIFAEHAEHGYLAAPIARHMIATYYAKKRGEPLPAFTAPGLPPPTPPVEEVPLEPDAPRPVADGLPTPTGGDR
jgi:penicillin-binding protein 2